MIVVAAIAALPALASVAQAGNCSPCGPCPPLCEAPVTKSYKVQPGFCATTLACMIPNCVEPDGSGHCCGPFGVPPVFASGNYVMVRQTVEGHERVAEFLTKLGAYVPPKPLQ